MKLRLILLTLLSTALLLALLFSTRQDYSYSTYTRINHVPAYIQCDLSTTVKCANSNTLPTIAQARAYQGYILWNSCYESHNTLACSALND